MSEKKPCSVSDVRPKSGLRSWSADSYAWRGKKRLRGNRTNSEAGTEGAEGGAEGAGPRCTSCPRRRRDRKCSCSSEEVSDAACRRVLSRRSLRQKFQDAVGQCLPLRQDHHNQSHQQAPGPPRAVSMLPWSKRKIHAAELVQDACTFSPKSELADLIKSHSTPLTDQGGVACTRRDVASTGGGVVSARGGVASPPPAHRPLSWEDVCCSLEEEAGCGGGHGCCGPAHRQALVPDLLQINNSAAYWGTLDRFQAEALLEGQPEGTFLLRDSAQESFLFSVSFRRYSRSLHARIEQSGTRFSFDVRDPCMYRDHSVTGLLRHYGDPAACLFFEPLLARPLPRRFPFALQRLCRAVICSCTTYQGIAQLPLPPPLRDYLLRYHVTCHGACDL